MTPTPSLTVTPATDGADANWYARAVLSDAPQHEDAIMATACHTLINDASTDTETRTRAQDMLVLIEGEMTP